MSAPAAFRYLFRPAAVLLLCASITVSQTSWQFRSDAENKFSAALKEYSSGQFAEAVATFDQITKLPPNQRTTAAFIMLGKSYYNAKRYRESVKVLKHFLDIFPESYYLGDAYHALGLNYMMQRRYDDALFQFLTVLEVSQDPKLRTRASSFCESIADDNLPVATLLDLLADTRNPDSRDFISVKIAEKHLTSGNVILGEKVLAPVVNRKRPSAYVSRAQTLLERMRAGINIKIGALLPLMSKEQQKNVKGYGEEFLLGMQFGLEEQLALEKSFVAVSLDVRDTERDPTVAVMRTRELADDKSVVALIGPVLGNEAISCVGVANAKEIPIIIPVANNDGIAAVGPYVFQVNPDISTRGKGAAQYATMILGMNTFAVLAPNAGSSKIMADAFIKEAVSQGGRVLATEWYAPGATDLREQLRRIRRASMIEAGEPMLSFAGSFTQAQIMQMIQAGAQPRMIDSLLDRAASISVYKLFGRNGKWIADTLHLHTVIPEVDIDSLELPATGIQGMYLPVDKAESIEILTSQMAYFAIKTQLVGSGEWYNEVELDASKRYAEGAIFFSDFFVDPRNLSYVGFARHFFEKTKKRVSANIVLGYDAINIALKQIFGGAMTREQLANALSELQNFDILHGKVSFRRNRINSNLHVLQYSNGQVKKIAEVAVQ